MTCHGLASYPKLLLDCLFDDNIDDTDRMTS